jgi:hypothetical protein
MDNGIFSESSGSDYRIEGAGSPDPEPEPQKKPPQKELALDKKRYNGRPHRINRLKSLGRKGNRSSTR